MIVNGVDNGDIIRIIVPKKVFAEIDKVIGSYDKWLRNGLREFLCLPLPECEAENDKPVFFEKTLDPVNGKSDIVYGRMLMRIVDDVLRKRFPCMGSDEYEVTLPGCSMGNYVGRKFTHIAPLRIRHGENIRKTVAKACVDIGFD